MADGQVAVCHLCAQAGVENPFAVPYPLDFICVALMEQHLVSEHGVKRLPTPLPRQQWSETPEQEGWWA